MIIQRLLFTLKRNYLLNLILFWYRDASVYYDLLQTSSLCYVHNWHCNFKFVSPYCHRASTNNINRLLDSWLAQNSVFKFLAFLFFFLKSKFPCPNKYKCQIRRGRFEVLRNRTLLISRWPEMLLPAVKGIKSAHLKSQFSLTFLQSFNFPWLKIPWLSTDHEFSPLDHSLTCRNLRSLRTQTYFRLSLVSAEKNIFRRRQAKAGNRSAFAG